MNISEPFIRRPIGTALLTLGLAFFGLLAYLKLPVSDLPSVDFPTISVSASLPGASPETMATAVATPLEKQFSTIASLDSMSSVSSEGSAQITLQFALERNIDAAAQDVQTAIATAARQLPHDMPSPPSFRKVNPADSSVILLALSSRTLPISKVDEIAENLLAQRISTLPGAAQVQVFGQQKYAVRVQLDPNRLAALGVGLDEVSTAIQNGNVNLPTGTLNGAQRAYSVEASGALQDAAAYRPLTVAYRNGAPVRLDSVAQVYRRCGERQVRARGSARISSAESCSPSIGSPARMPSSLRTPFARCCLRCANRSQRDSICASCTTARRLFRPPCTT